MFAEPDWEYDKHNNAITHFDKKNNKKKSTGSSKKSNVKEKIKKPFIEQASNKTNYKFINNNSTFKKQNQFNKIDNDNISKSQENSIGNIETSKNKWKIMKINKKHKLESNADSRQRIESKLKNMKSNHNVQNFDSDKQDNGTGNNLDVKKNNNKRKLKSNADSRQIIEPKQKKLKLGEATKRNHFEKPHEYNIDKAKTGNNKQTVKKKNNKRKLESKDESKQIVKPKQKKIKSSKTTQNFDTDKPDEAIMNEAKQIITNNLQNDDNEHTLFTESKSNSKKKRGKNIVETSDNSNLGLNTKKEKLKKLLKMTNVRTVIKTNSQKLRERMLEKLKAAQFRYLNEKLYTTSGTEAQELFQNDPVAFQTYHEGYQQQLKKWPINPLDVIVKKLSKMPTTLTVADMGCGEANLSKRVRQTVRSFDLVAAAPGVEACDMARTPLLAASIDVVVYCLALMGTELTRYLVEANRIMKRGGTLLIAEVESRFDDVDAFTKEVQRLGFKLTQLDKTHDVFVFLEYKKVNESPKRAKLPDLTLKPCLYKRR